MTVPAENFMATIAANVDNEKLTDKEFRQFVRHTLPIVDYPRPEGKKAVKWLCKVGIHDWKDLPHPLTIFASREKCKACDLVRDIPEDLSALDGI